MARSFRHGRQTRIIADGVDLSCYLKEASVSATVDTPETTAFCDTIKQWVSGLPDYSASLSGMFEATATTGLEQGSDTVLFAKFGKEQVLNIIHSSEGSQAGRRSRAFGGLVTSYNIQNTVADMVALNMDMKITGQLYICQNLTRFGVDRLPTSITTPFAVVADRTTVFGASSPYAASTYNGYVLLQMKNTSSASATVILEDSADNTTWAALGGMSSVTLAAGEVTQLVVADTAIARYIRVKLSAAPTTNAIDFYMGLVDPNLSPIVAG